MFGSIARVVVFGVTVAAASQIPLQTPPSVLGFAPDLSSIIDEIRRNGSIPGLSVGVVRIGEDGNPFVRLGSWGQKTEGGDGHDLTVDTLFGIASCSKAFLATSLGMLMDDYAHGRNATPLPPTVQSFDYDTKVVDILPKELGWGLHDLYGDTWATKKASIKDVFGHVSGMAGSDYTYSRSDQPEDVVRRMHGLRTAFELREKWSYNNQMYMLGSVIVSTYAGMPYSQFATERIFEPLKMSGTTFRVSTAQRSGKLSDAWTKDGRRIPFWFDDSTMELKAGVGGVMSSAEDMVKWLAVWLNKGVDPVSGTEIFPRSVYDAVTTAHFVASGRPNPYGASPLGYGMGWQQSSLGNIEIIQHGGAIPGFSTLTVFSPSHNLGVFMTANADEKHAHFTTILKEIISNVLGEKPTFESPPEETLVLERPLDIKPPTLDFESYVGTYGSFGFSAVTLCSPRILPPSHYCDQVLADFASLDSLSSIDTNATLYSTYPSVWATHVRLQHFSGDVFNITFTALFPHGYGRNTSAFETYETGTSGGWVEFDASEGRVLGFSLVQDQVAVAARTRRSPSGQLKEVADAWFEKV